MDFREFLLKINKLGYGVVSFNTYKLNDNYGFYIMVAKKGDSGIFNKIEGKVKYLNVILDDFIKIIEKDSILKIVEL